ncbi:ion channel [Novosphingobium sp.]|uniref:ion channel n=1 Tax=Novosphingobium sp. TaxID=1874826 RepID=UPI0035AEDE78
MAQLFAQFIIAAAMVVLCVAIHGFGLFGLNRAVRTEAAIERIQRIDPLSPRGVFFTLTIVIAMLALHGLEIWLFTLVYLVTGAINNLEAALYFSTISYSTVGYNDTHVVSDWRLLGAFESILGVFLLGWSTAFFFKMLGRIDPH